jgi:hypothetical protein
MTTREAKAGESLVSIAAEIEDRMRAQALATAEAVEAGGDAAAAWRALASLPMFGTEEFEEWADTALWATLLQACGGDGNAARRAEIEPGAVVRVPVLCGHPVVQRSERGRQPELCAKDAPAGGRPGPEDGCPMCEATVGGAPGAPHTSRRAAKERDRIKANATAVRPPAPQPQPAPAPAPAPAPNIVADAPGEQTAETDPTPVEGEKAIPPAAPVLTVVPAPAPAQPSATRPAARTEEPAVVPAAPAAAAGSAALAADLAAFAQRLAAVEASHAADAEAQRAAHEQAAAELAEELARARADGEALAELLETERAAHAERLAADRTAVAEAADARLRAEGQTQLLTEQMGEQADRHAAELARYERLVDHVLAPRAGHDPLEAVLGDLVEPVDARAAAEGTTRLDVVRAAVAAYLAPHAPEPASGRTVTSKTGRTAHKPAQPPKKPAPAGRAEMLARVERGEITRVALRDHDDGRTLGHLWHGVNGEETTAGANTLAHLERTGLVAAGDPAPDGAGPVALTDAGRAELAVARAARLVPGGRYPRVPTDTQNAAAAPAATDPKNVPGADEAEPRSRVGKVLAGRRNH